MQFRGTVIFRSSVPSVGASPPGEAEIQRLNPNRVDIYSDCNRLAGEPGSLNLNVRSISRSGRCKT
jgi:hypothetical protein